MTTTIKAPPRTKTQMVAALREIIESPDDVQQWELGGLGTVVEDVANVNVERLKALLPQPKATVPDGDRDGVTYDPELDYERLNKQMQKVWRVVRTGRWYTLNDLALATGCPAPSVSARLRDLRKPKFGSQEVQRKRIEGGYWIYRVVPTKREED